MTRNNFPDELRRKGDFQHLPMWRRFNYQILAYLDEQYAGTVIVPMTLYIKSYYDEIVQALQSDGVVVHHFILTAEKDVITQRLRGRGEGPNNWAEQQIGRCLQAYQTNISGHTIDTSRLSVEDVVRYIIQKTNEWGGDCAQVGS